MINSRKYISRPSKLKRFSKKSLYRKVYPSFIRKEIPDDFLTSDGYTKEQLIKDIYRLIDCNKKMSFINKTVIENAEHIKKTELFEVNHCNIFTLCSICAEKISRRRREKYKPDILELAEKHKHCYMITFTTRNVKTYNESYNQLRKAIRKYVLMGQLRGVTSSGEEIRSGGEANKIKAMAVSIENKIGKKSKAWHLHGHAIAFSDERIDYQIYDTEKKKRIRTEFKEKYGRTPEPADLKPAVMVWGEIDRYDERGKVLTDGYGETLKHKVPLSKASGEWIEATDGVSSNIKFKPITGTPEEIYKQCVEIIKYTSKIATFSKDNIIEVLINRKGKRYFSTYGELYKRHTPDCTEDESVLFIEGITGYVWSDKKGEMIPMIKREKQDAARRYENRERIYKAQGLIMKAYYEKQTVLKTIMNEVMKNRKREDWIDYKRRIIKHIDELEAAYNYSKRKIYNNIMRTSYKIPTWYKPTPIQEMYTKRIDNILQAV